MTDHLLHVAAAWALAAAGFGGLALGAAWRHRAAARRLRALERLPRAPGLRSREAGPHMEAHVGPTGTLR